MRQLSFRDAIREATEVILENWREAFIMGEGVGDPKQIFGTTTGLKDKFPDRVFDCPISENALTGVCIGAATQGLKPILVHQRIDFSLYAMDQMVNNAAKWHSMFGGLQSVPMVVRMIVGRGWGQGNQHSQNLQALYAHVPGLKIVVPSNALRAKGLLIAAIQDPNPVLIIEHRWLYDTTSTVQEGVVRTPLGVCQYERRGNDLTIVASGYSLREADYACQFLNQQGVSVDLIDLVTIKPLDISTILESVGRTGRLVVIDDAWKFCGVAGEIIAQVAESGVPMTDPPIRVTYPDYPSGSSPALTKHYYPGPFDIACAIEQSIKKGLDLDHLMAYQRDRIHDVPDKNFGGPF